MIEPFEIRHASYDDAETISALVRHTIRISNATDYPAVVIDRLVGNFTADAIRGLMAKRVVWIAQQGHELQGTASIDGDMVRTVFVSPEAQGRGIGRMLMSAVEAFAADNGTELVRVQSSSTARSFYSRLGYFDVRAMQYGEERTFLMEKNLKLI
ncbi:GNAT family N-acetyltransferase [Rhizobium sp.]|uniref:GNAT family N-acetyltransferase n=1 Tax=Rhizobium sp. TaxID=391 RepID=UPI0028B128A6